MAKALAILEAVALVAVVVAWAGSATRALVAEQRAERLAGELAGLEAAAAVAAAVAARPVKGAVLPRARSEPVGKPPSRPGNGPERE